MNWVLQTVNDFFLQPVLGNGVRSWMYFALTLLLGSLTARFVSSRLSKLAFKWLQKTDLSSGQEIIKFYEQTRGPIQLIFTWLYLYVAFNFLHWPPEVVEACSSHIDLRKATSFIYSVSLIWIVTNLALKLLHYFVERVKLRQASGQEQHISPQALMFVQEVGRIGIYIVAGLVFLGVTLGRDVGTFIGGLGIGGLAIAFAAKETLENLIASVIIFLDKPFSVGDVIEVDGQKGVIESVGLRSTRIRTFERSLVAVPNKKMVDGMLINMSLRPSARVKFFVGIHHGTSILAIEGLIENIKTYIASHPDTTEEQYIYLTDVRDEGAFVQVQFYVNTLDANIIWQTQQDVNLHIISLMDQGGISFAELKR